MRSQLDARLIAEANAAVPAGGVRMSEIMSALSYALDITEGQPEGHALRSCMIGMRVGQLIGLSTDELSALYYALLLKDLGCSSNAARMSRLFAADDRSLKYHFKFVDHTDLRSAAAYTFRSVMPSGSLLGRLGAVVRIAGAKEEVGRGMIQTRCERGAAIARRLGLAELSAQAILALDELWNGAGHPRGLRGDQIPILGRILGLAQTMEVFLARDGVDGAFAMLRQRRGRWFDPALVKAVESIRRDERFWGQSVPNATIDDVIMLEPVGGGLRAGEERIDSIAEAFAMVIDAKSPFTARHSEGVAAAALGIADVLGMNADERRHLRRAALLHDIGKLGVSNQILDKPGKLTPEEFAEIKKHPVFTLEILSRVTVFKPIAAVAAQHHERLDGKGYHSGLTDCELGSFARVLAVADIAEALTADRPYRAGLPWEEVMGIIGKQAGTGLCRDAVDALGAIGHVPRPTSDPLTCELSTAG